MSKNKGIVVVTGAGGCVGSHLVEVACRAGYRVRAIDRPGVDIPVPEGCDIEKIFLDLTKTHDYKDVLKDAKGVFHLAALVDIAAPFSIMANINLYPTIELYESAVADNVPYFQFYSTGSVYRVHPGSIKEDDELWTPNDYVRSKLLAEQYLKAQDGKTVVNIIRPGLIFGPRGRVLAAGYAASMCLAKRLFGVFPNLKGGPRTNMIHALDLARASLHLFEHPAPHGEAFNVAMEEAIPFLDVFTITAQILGMKVLPITIEAPPPWVMKQSVKLLNVLPVLDVANVVVQGVYRIVTKMILHGDSPILPRLDKEAMVYAVSDVILDNTKLKSTGFRFKYPEFKRAWEDTIRWYRENRWIPC